MCLIISIGMLYAGILSMTLSNAFYIVNIICHLKRPKDFQLYLGGRRGRDNMIVGFTTTYGISTYHL
jgi:hypothetical protein